MATVAVEFELRAEPGLVQHIKRRPVVEPVQAKGGVGHRLEEGLHVNGLPFGVQQRWDVQGDAKDGRQVGGAGGRNGSHLRRRHLANLTTSKLGGRNGSGTKLLCPSVGNDRRLADHLEVDVRLAGAGLVAGQTLPGAAILRRQPGDAHRDVARVEEDVDLLGGKGLHGGLVLEKEDLHRGVVLRLEEGLQADGAAGVGVHVAGKVAAEEGLHLVAAWLHWLIVAADFAEGGAHFGHLFHLLLLSTDLTFQHYSTSCWSHHCRWLKGPYKGQGRAGDLFGSLHSRLFNLSLVAEEGRVLDALVALQVLPIAFSFSYLMYYLLLHQTSAAHQRLADLQLSTAARLAESITNSHSQRTAIRLLNAEQRQGDVSVAAGNDHPLAGHQQHPVQGSPVGGSMRRCVRGRWRVTGWAVGGGRWGVSTVSRARVATEPTVFCAVHWYQPASRGAREFRWSELEAVPEPSTEADSRISLIEGVGVPWARQASTTASPARALVLRKRSVNLGAAVVGRGWTVRRTVKLAEPLWLTASQRATADAALQADDGAKVGALDVVGDQVEARLDAAAGDQQRVVITTSVTSLKVTRVAISGALEAPGGDVRADLWIDVLIVGGEDVVDVQFDAEDGQAVGVLGEQGVAGGVLGQEHVNVEEDDAVAVLGSGSGRGHQRGAVLEPVHARQRTAAHLRLEGQVVALVAEDVLRLLHDLRRLWRADVSSSSVITSS
ncbi:hypothetical protein TYRP_007699 [Tyrophagus putrescentiae]|nr:hypothetical protein TYRP_007699 [Tyrophagus putrescentiae]